MESNVELLLMDELRGRRIALARKLGIFTEVKPLLEALMNSEFRITKAFYHKVLSQAGETSDAG